VFKKIELWLVGLIILFFIILIIFISGVLRDAYLGINKTPPILRDNLTIVAEIPKNIFQLTNFFLNKNAPPKLQKNKDKKRFQQFIKNNRNALLVLPRYDHSLKRSVIDVIDLNNFKLLHTYKHDIIKMNSKVRNKVLFPRLSIDDSPIRFEYWHPLILNDGSIISESDRSPLFKIDFCSSLVWINDEIIFHHSKMLDHEKNIWVGGQMNPKSKFVLNNQTTNYDNFWDDSITKISIDGEVLYNKSIIEILIENNFLDMNIFDGNTDPIHLNDIEPALNSTKYWKQGDIFLSLRNQSAIIHYRPDTDKVINYITGPFAMQHDVDIISDKEISIFNNNNFVSNNKYSEVIIFNFETKKFRKLFNNQLQKENFKTYTEGLSHIFEDKSLLVEEQNHGRIILFNSSGEKEWEFVNKDKNQDIGRVNWSRIIEDELFIENFKSLVKNKKCLN
tara:strand:+ start:478 stop:1821 length:1344 start_codon:yes stop_codon:yes gene_type:complete